MHQTLFLALKHNSAALNESGEPSIATIIFENFDRRQPNQNTKGRYIMMISHDTAVVTMLFLLCQQGEQIGIIVTIDEY
ncbi:MAG: hypothetical protein WBZ36_05980 [Candidatus Nitrosopolaris sp.]